MSVDLLTPGALRLVACGIGLLAVWCVELSPRGRLARTRAGMGPDPLRARVIVALVGGGGGAAVLGLGGLSVALSVALLAGTGAWWLLDVRRARLQRATHAALGAWIGAMIAALSAGAAPAAALDRAVEALPEATPPDLRGALTHAARRCARQGVPVSVALADAPALTSIASVLALSERSGVPIADLLRQVQRRVDARRRHAAATTAALQGPQATAVLLTCLPLGGLGVGTAMGARPWALLTGGGWGGVLLLAGVSAMCAGFLWSRCILMRAVQS